MKEDIQTLSDVGWDGLDSETKTRLKKSYPINLLQSVSDSGWESISDDTKNQIRTIFNKPLESPAEMRARAKAEFASDWLAQKKAEAESIRETTEGKILSALFPRVVENTVQKEQYDDGNPFQPLYHSYDAVKDLTSMTGRALGRLFGGDREDLQKFSEEYPVLTKIAGITRGIVEDPLLPLFMGIGSAPISIGAKMAAGSVLPFTDITIEKSKIGETPTVLDAGISLLQGVLPEAIGLGAAKYGARALKAAENIEPLKKITAYEDFLRNELGSIAKKSPSIFEVQEILRKGLAEGKLQASMRKKAEEILGLKNVGEYGGDVLSDFGNLARDKLANATAGRTIPELGSELFEKLKGVLPEAVPVMAMEAAASGRLPLIGAAYGAIKAAKRAEPSLAPRIGKIIQGVGENVNLPKLGGPAARQLAGRVPQSAIGQTLRTPERMDTQSFSDSDARLYNRQMEILRFDPNDPNAKRIAQEIASKYR